MLIDRTTRRGQLRSYKESVAYLQDGVGIFAFPEGTRSRTGRMMPFKGGVFSMAMKAGVPIVPISLVGTFATYPPSAVLPPTAPCTEGGRLSRTHKPPVITAPTFSTGSLSLRTLLMCSCPVVPSICMAVARHGDGGGAARTARRRLPRSSSRP